MEGVGLSADTKISQGRRQMLDLVNKLHTTGVQVDIDLPRIAVIGSQSAGKSSLIESISGITLPRAAGTCTRCPVECRLSSSKTPWQCVVTLRFISDSRGVLLGQARNKTFGKTIYNKELVEDRIRRAQRAVLNPKVTSKSFLTGDIDDEFEGMESQLSFTRNCVSLDISGPDVADLSFCDLPGLIASVSSNTQGGSADIALVENLVSSYIKNPSCIILLTVACETDFENQGAHSLAKRYDPEGKRTIGVLTKPDRIPTGEEGNWLPFLRNEKEPLENNWFCVKQPSSNDLKTKMTWAQARTAEDTYFATTAPWNELDSMYQQCLRTANLIQKLSIVLSSLIAKRLPEIAQELHRTITSTRTALNALPRAPSSNPQAEISAMLYAFVTDLERHLEGVPDEDGLLQAIRPAQERFRRSIRETAPNFRPFEKKHEGQRHMRRAKFLVIEEGKAWEGEDSEEDLSDDDDDADSEAEAADSDAEAAGSDAEAADSEAEVEPEPEAASRGSKANKAVDAPVNKLKRKYAESSSNKIFIDEVSKRANRARTRELPGHYPFIVQKSFIEGIIGQWKEPAAVLSRTIYRDILKQVTKLVTKHFNGFGQGVLENRVNTIMVRHMQKCMSETEERIIWLLRLEEQPFSLNTHYLSDYREKFLAFYKDERRRYTHKNDGESAPVNQEDLKNALAALAKLGMTGVKQGDLWKLHASDQMEPALTIMAEVRAYFQVAYKRFSDNLPLMIDFELVRGTARNILSVLSESLGINGVDGHATCEEFAEESSQVASKRTQLNKRLERLESAHTELSWFMDRRHTAAT